ncbi:MAG: hypothetical protein ACOYLB_04450 [Phototrophicaceae bacterium]
MKVVKGFFKAIGKLLGAIGLVFWRFMVIFSFVVNIILVLVLAVLLLLIFQIKNQVASPLLTGLHSSFVGLNEATIDWTIPVRDTVPVVFNLPLEQNTVVVLTDNVPLVVSANIELPGIGNLNNAQVNLTLPKGLPLPVALDLDVPVNTDLDIALDVRAVIPLSETQLQDPFENLRLLFEPLIIPLENLPNDFSEAWVMGNTILSGQTVDLYDTANSDYLAEPWGGFSRTAGLGYELLDVSRGLNVSSDGTTNANIVLTGIQAIGGIPFLDAIVRPELYANDSTPSEVNLQTQAELTAKGIPAASYAGDFETLPADAGAVSQSASGGATAPVEGVILPDNPPQPVFTPMPNN